MNWQQIEDLRTDGVHERTLTDLARKHGLDMPHVPVLAPALSPGGVELQTFTVSCAGCSLKHNQPISPCLQGPDGWDYPAEVVNLRPVVRVLEQAAAMIRAET